jgi:predicted ATPase
MSEPSGTEDESTLVLRISIPAGAEYRAIVMEMAAKVAAYVGDTEQDGAAAATALEALAAQVTAASGGDADATFEFRQSDQALLMRAHCAGRSADASRPLASRT